MGRYVVAGPMRIIRAADATFIHAIAEEAREHISLEHASFDKPCVNLKESSFEGIMSFKTTYIEKDEQIVGARPIRFTPAFNDCTCIDSIRHATAV